MELCIVRRSQVAKRVCVPVELATTTELLAEQTFLAAKDKSHALNFSALATLASLKPYELLTTRFDEFPLPSSKF